MAGAPDMIPLAKTVQEMSVEGDDPPPEFLLKDDIRLGPGPPDSSFSVPIIDLSLLSSPVELQKLRSAVTSIGCFQTTGHGISGELLDNVREAAKQFYCLPLEEKHKYSREVNQVEGYGHDKRVSDKQVLDWSSRLILRVFPEHERKLHLWPENPQNFRDILHEYSVKLKLMMNRLSKAMAKSLNMEESSFSNQFGDQEIMQARFNFYPPCSRPDKVLGIKSHSDSSGITVLLQDQEMEGLQILKDDTWIMVPVLPHALVVNLGDQMQIMSNGIFKSPLHRAVTNNNKLRISVAMFNWPEQDKVIGPGDELVDAERPRMYKNVKNFADFNYECYQKGIVALDQVKIS